MKKLWEDCDEDGRKILKKMGLTLVLLILANFLTGVAAVTAVRDGVFDNRL